MSLSRSEQESAPQRPGPRRIFRPAAVERYVSRAMETVLPRFVAPRALSWLWLATALLLAALFVVAVLLESRGGTLVSSWLDGSSGIG
jgi:hypothetical protein